MNLSSNLPAHFKKYSFAGQSGYVLAPGLPGGDHQQVSIRHSSLVEPWKDGEVHLHEHSEEFYLLLQGILWILVDQDLILLEPNQILQVGEKIPHAVMYGEGKIEHFVIRTPAIDDRKSCGPIPEKFASRLESGGREIHAEWGTRVSIDKEVNRECWLFGYGQARFTAKHLCLAFMRYPTQELASQYNNSYRHSLHAHQGSWEYYTVLKGAKTLRVEDEMVTVHAGEILEVPPKTRHVFQAVSAPFEGFTFRTPLLDDKVDYSLPGGTHAD